MHKNIGKLTLTQDRFLKGSTSTRWSLKHLKDDLVDVRYSDQGKKNDWTTRLKRYVNLVEYTDDQILKHIIEPHKT